MSAKFSGKFRSFLSRWHRLAVYDPRLITEFGNREPRSRLPVPAVSNGPLSVIRLLLQFLIFVAVVVLGVGFANLNVATAPIDLWFVDAELPVYLLVLLSLGVGVVVGYLGGLVSYVKLWGRNSSLRRRERLAREELDNLRSIPVKDH